MRTRVRLDNRRGLSLFRWRLFTVGHEPPLGNTMNRVILISVFPGGRGGRYWGKFLKWRLWGRKFQG